MKTRQFGRDSIQFSEVGMGCWQLGGSWGEVALDDARSILKEAIDSGITFFDTADVYGDGRSETIIGEFFKSSKESIFVATKVGRSDKLYPDKYTEAGVRASVEGSLKRLQRETLDLIQLHCVPGELLKQGDIFEWLRTLKKEGKIQRFGASVESMEEAEVCIKQAPELYSLQIIFNVFRQQPIEALFETARQKQIAIIVRLPLASGMLTGKFDLQTTFDKNDHRHFNRDGQMFNVGETFAGIPFPKAIELVEELKAINNSQLPLAQMALRWILDYEAVSVIIPGASKPGQAARNAIVSDLAPLDQALHKDLSTFFDRKVKQHIRGPI